MLIGRFDSSSSVTSHIGPSGLPYLLGVLLLRLLQFLTLGTPRRHKHETKCPTSRHCLSISRRPRRLGKEELGSPRPGTGYVCPSNKLHPSWSSSHYFPQGGEGPRGSSIRPIALAVGGRACKHPSTPSTHPSTLSPSSTPNMYKRA
ncbi:hypothetical protein LY78DRAFT_366714 [Colletotrichum sublineola]|nr:hypothetical protein LY78DRAFT_366714 [Colletotrichum sublineola]